MLIKILIWLQPKFYYNLFIHIISNYILYFQINNKTTIIKVLKKKKKKQQQQQQRILFDWYLYNSYRKLFL